MHHHIVSDSSVLIEIYIADKSNIVYFTILEYFNSADVIKFTIPQPNLDIDLTNKNPKQYTSQNCDSFEASDVEDDRYWHMIVVSRKM